ncbi:deleted in lung and esophageal cancer protein 1-like [Callorhinus ursinus]|uniref:deleted in lung and esophageal cancer protein 1-like n=1 Tax=Callorhinus ursinus TaxID=34884 RepID=UPI003CD042B0
MRREPDWRFIAGLGSYGYGGQEAPPSAACKLENQESRWLSGAPCLWTKCTGQAAGAGPGRLSLGWPRRLRVGRSRAGALPGSGGRGGKDDGAPGGEAAAGLRQPQVTGVFTSAQVNVSFSLSLELLSYQRLPADQMLPGVDIRQRASGEKEMVFTQNLLLEYANQTTQVVPLRATVAVPELQLSTSWVDFGTCFVNQGQVREVYLMNLSGCRSYWAVLMGQQEPDKDPVAFRVSPNRGLLDAGPVNVPPNTITLRVQTPFLTSASHSLQEQ